MHQVQLHFIVTILSNQYCQHGKFGLTGVFPGVTLSFKEADALAWVLEKKFWWCTESSNFPLLIVSSCNYPLINILQRISLKDYWSQWTQFDNFPCLIIVLAASTPFLNQAVVSIEKQGALQGFALDLEQCIHNDFLEASKPADISNSKKFSLPLFDSSDNEKPRRVLPQFESDDDYSIHTCQIKPQKSNNDAEKMQSLKELIWDDDEIKTPSGRISKRQRSTVMKDEESATEGDVGQRIHHG